MFGYHITKKLEANNRIPDEAWGSRSSFNAILAAVNRRLVINIFKQKCRCGVIDGFDAAQYYDRIVHYLYILLCQKEGAPLSSCLMMFGIMQYITYFIRTTFGDSKGSYGGHQETPFQGTCNGNGASPEIWLLISVHLVLLMIEIGHLFSTRAPLSGVVGFSFRLRHGYSSYGREKEEETAVYSRLQREINFWNGILRVSGGTLKP